MNELNSVIIEGTIKEVSFPDLPNGKTVAKCTLINKRLIRNSNGETVDDSEIFDFEAWGALADFLKTHGNINRGVRVVGRLKRNHWENNTKVVIVAEHIDFKPFVEETEEKNA